MKKKLNKEMKRGP